MPKYNDVAEQWIGLLREKTIALLGDLEKLVVGLGKEKYWAEAWNYSTDVTNMYATTSNANGITPYQMWYIRSPPLNLLHPFGTVSYLRRMKRGHKLAPRGEKCLMIGIAQNHPSSTFRAVNVNNDKVIIGQNASWHPETPEVRGDGDQTAPSGRESTTVKQMPQPSLEVNMEVITAMTPTTQQPERTVELPEGPL